ncbi:MAG: DUF5719 family protein [Acidimicrobiia bacterium]
MRASLKVAALAVVALLAVAAIVTPSQDPPMPDSPSAPVAAPYTVCPLGRAARRTTVLALVGGSEGTAGITIFSAGAIVVEDEIAVPAEAATSFVLNELTGLAQSPALVALPDSGAAMETILSGAGQAASSCEAGSPGTVILPAGSTVEGETYTLILTNPFAGSATVNIGAASEVGTESDPALTGVIVPPRSVVPVDLSTLLRGRQSMSVSVTPAIGRVVTSTLQEGSGDVATVSGLVPGNDWFLPVPTLEGARRSITVATAGTAEVPFQLDVYDQDGLFEAAYEDTVPARGQATIDVADLFEGAGAVRVVAAGPVAAALRFDGEGVRTVTPAVSAPGPSWLLPGAGRLGTTSVHLFNPGEIDVQAQVLAGNGSDVLETLAIPGGTVGVVTVPSGGHGVRVEADGDLVPSWMTATNTGVAGDAARPSTQ